VLKPASFELPICYFFLPASKHYVLYSQKNFKQRFADS
jgi:hypothetical protein